MKKQFLTSLALIIVLIPQVTFAAWWNPFTWFQKPTTQPKVVQIKIATTTPTVEDLQKQIEELKQQVNGKDKKPNVVVPAKKPQPIEIKTPPANLTVASTSPAMVIDTPVLSVSVLPTNPSAQCIPIKKSWNAFVIALSNADDKLNSLQKAYNDYTEGTKNAPTGSAPWFSYEYSLMTAGKDNFLSQIDELKKVSDTIPQPPVGTSYDWQNIKNAYLSSAKDMESSFDLVYQGVKMLAEDKNGIGTNDLDTAESLVKDSIDQYHKAFDEITVVNSFVTNSEAGLNTEQPNGCAFTFYGDQFLSYRGIVTTTKDELAFSQYTPTFEISKDFSHVTISTVTTLPIQINDNGTTTTIMQLSCNRYGTKEISPVERIDQYHIQTILGKTLTGGNGRQCRFIYTGNGDPLGPLGTQIIEFNL